MSCRSCTKSIGRQRPAVQRVAGMFAQEPSPDFDVPGRREPGERPELVAEVGLAEMACATGEVAPVDRSGGVDRCGSGTHRREGQAVLIVPPLRCGDGTGEDQADDEKPFPNSLTSTKSPIAASPVKEAPRWSRSRRAFVQIPRTFPGMSRRSPGRPHHWSGHGRPDQWWELAVGNSVDIHSPTVNVGPPRHVRVLFGPTRVLAPPVGVSTRLSAVDEEA